MNREMPLVPAGAPSSAGQDEMDDVLGQIVLAVGDEDLGAEDAGTASPSRTARVRTAPRSEPACGSVRHMAPVHSPLISLVA